MAFRRSPVRSRSGPPTSAYLFFWNDPGCHIARLDSVQRRLYSWCRTPMRQAEPVDQLLGRLVRRLAVEGHHGSRHTWSPKELGAPPIADGDHFDVVRAPADGLFEAMDDHV